MDPYFLIGPVQARVPTQKVGVFHVPERMLDFILGAINDAMRQGKGNVILGATVNGLIAYAALHFKTEEKFFDLFGYPAAKSHKKEHADFTEKVSAFKDEFEQGRLGLTIHIMNFLSDHGCKTTSKGPIKNTGLF